jgi:hypothetical protein
VDPAAQAHARHAQDFGDPSRTLSLEEEQQGRDLYPNPRTRDFLG